MKTMDFVKVLRLDQRNLDNERKVINVKEENITKLSNYNFLIRTLETYNDRKFKNNELVKEFIKINLPHSLEEAHTQWFEGVEYNSHKYFAWFATVGGMKQEKNGICETIFIREDNKEFAELVENLVSMGKFTELEQKEEIICINKDVLSRLSLITTDLVTEIEMPNFIVLPQSSFHLIKDYKTVKPFTFIEKKERKLKNGTIQVKEVEHVDYNLIDIHFDGNIDIFDGGAVATPNVFETIGKALNRKDIEFAIIRGYGLAIKGLITKFDIIKYLDVMYFKIGNTDYFRKTEDDQYQLLDRWREWQTVTEDTMLLNDSMIKLAKYFENIKDYKDCLEKLNNDEYKKYHKLLNRLYIAKVNKRADEIKDYRRTNYQLINALALTPQAYQELIKEDLKLYKKILKPYDCKKGEADTKEFMTNIDYINLFYNNVVNSDINEDDEDFDEKADEIINNIVDKVNELININSEFVKLDYVKRNLRKLIEKKVREIALGKLTIKAKYQYIAICPISYLNWAIIRNQGENGLEEGQFYSADCQDGDIRTIQRNPLSAYSEVHNIKFVRNAFYDNWLSSCKELIYFNQKSDILSLLSSADCDGDACTTIDSEIVRNAVVTPRDGKYFITKKDGEKKVLSYNKENRFKSTYLASGNLIGKIALKSANVNCNCQVVPDYYDTINRKFINYKDLRVELYDLKLSIEENKGKYNKYIEGKLESKEWIRGYSKEVDKELSDYMREKYYENEKDIYIILYNAMCAIDAPKTLVFPSNDDMETINNKYYKKVNFLQYKEGKENVSLMEYYHRGNNLLDFFSIEIQKRLLDIIEGNEKNRPNFSDRFDLIKKSFQNDDYCEGMYELCFKEIKELYNVYSKERQEAESICKKENTRLWKDRKFQLDESGTWDSWKEAEYLVSREVNKKIKYVAYKEIDKKYIQLSDELFKKFDISTICQCVSDLDKCTENFVLSLFWRCFSFVNKKLNNTRYVYQKCNDGDIEYLYEKYKKIEVNEFDNSKLVGRIDTEDKIKMKLEHKIRFKMNDNSIIEEIQNSLDKNEMYELNLEDERVQVFEEFSNFIKDKEILKIVQFDTNKNGKVAIAAKSFGVIVEV